MRTILSRRAALLGGLSLIVTTGFARAQNYDDLLFDSPATPDEEMPTDQDPGFERDPDLLPPPESPIDYPIPPVNMRKIPQEFRRQVVPFDDTEWPGTIIVDPRARHLYLVLGGGEAMRFGVGVGRSGFEWSGEAEIGLKRRWPRWVPPLEMVARDEKAAKWANGMPGGPENPLGARALYLYHNGQDTLYRIHGTNEPSSIGKNMSSGCIRMLNEDVAELYRRVPIGSRVIVLSAEQA